MHEYSYCGLDCHNCDFKEKCNCKGCKASQGEPFHGSCELAKCAIEKDIAYCSECKEFPCALLNSYSYNPVHGDNGMRINVLNEMNKETI